MGGLFSGLQERRTDALVRLAYAIKQAKLDIASDQSRRRRTRVYLSWMYALVPVVTVVVCMFGLNESWWMSIIYATPLVLLIVIVNWLIKWQYDRALCKSRAILSKLKDEKRKVLEEIKNTENYMVAKDLLDKFDNSDEETEDNVPLVRESADVSMA